MSVTEPVKVLIGIVTYNHRRFIADCLDSVPASAKRYAIKTVVVDSNSSDGSADLVRDQYPGVELIQRDRLYSFSNNNNVAYASSPSEYFLLLNPDTELSEGAVDLPAEYADLNWFFRMAPYSIPADSFLPSGPPLSAALHCALCFPKSVEASST
jgi:GT2 family glycosyltransferase